MRYYSSNNPQHQVDFKTAILTGLAPDQGLYLPCSIPQFPTDFWKDSQFESAWQLASAMLYPYVKEFFTPQDFADLLQDCLSFDFPLHPMGNDYVLELFHGPTLAFKDVGARFLARCMSKLSDRKHTILVATSGDTGSAVAQGFYKMPHVDVVILYPKNRISPTQEKQLTTVGENVVAVEIDGSFDQCQALVKQAFLDQDLCKARPLSSANSINIARWLPQSIYYAWSVHQVASQVSFCVPSGNYGNLAAGTLAMSMGMPCAPWIVASNANDVVPQYLQQGQFLPHASRTTLSNAMDVGNPSNFTRLQHLFNPYALCNHHMSYDQNYSPSHMSNLAQVPPTLSQVHSGDQMSDDHVSGDQDHATWLKMRQSMYGYAVTDSQTIDGIQAVYNQYHYMIDPHTAVAYHAVQQHKDALHTGSTQKHTSNPSGTMKDKEDLSYVILATASPAKFSEVMTQAIQQSPPVPTRLQKIIQRVGKKVSLSAEYEMLKNYLIDSNLS